MVVASMPEFFQLILREARMIAITEGFGIGMTVSILSGMPAKRLADEASTVPVRNPCFFQTSC